MRPQAHFSSEGFRRPVVGGGRNGFRPHAAEFRRSPAQIFIEVVCTEHIGRKTGCLPLKRGIGPGRLSVVAVRRGRLDEPCRAAAQRGIPCAGGPHLRAASAPLDGRRRRGGRQGDGACLVPCVGRHSIVRPWGCRCVGGGVCYETVQEKNRGELGAAALRTGASLAFPGARCARRRSGNLVRSRMPRGASAAAHEAALRRMRQAGVRWTSIAQVACELQCDRSRRRPTPGSVAFFFRDAGISPNRGRLGRARCGATGRSGPKRGCRRVSCALRWEGVRMAVRMKRDCPRFAGQPLFVRIPRLLAARAPFSAKPFFGP